MANIKIDITLSSSEKSIITKEISEGLLATFDQIEDFATQIKRVMLPDLQSDLLLKSQLFFKKNLV